MISKDANGCCLNEDRIRRSPWLSKVITLYVTFFWEKRRNQKERDVLRSSDWGRRAASEALGAGGFIVGVYVVLVALHFAMACSQMKWSTASWWSYNEGPCSLCMLSKLRMIAPSNRILQQLLSWFKFQLILSPSFSLTGLLETFHIIKSNHLYSAINAYLPSIVDPIVLGYLLPPQTFRNWSTKPRKWAIIQSIQIQL